MLDVKGVNMKLNAFFKLLKRRINKIDTKAQNPFVDDSSDLNPFNKPYYNTLIWIENEIRD